MRSCLGLLKLSENAGAPADVSVDSNDPLVRQRDFLSEEHLKTPVTLIGAGAIGSSAAMSLSKSGFSNIEVWDPDVVSIQNMNCQWYRFDDVGKPKVEALQEQCAAQGTPLKRVHQKLFDVDQAQEASYLLVAVDSLTARDSIFRSLERVPYYQHIIDARMGIIRLTLLYCDRRYTKAWDNLRSHTRPEEDDRIQERCTMKSTMFTSMLAGAEMAAVFVSKCRATVRSYSFGFKNVNVCRPFVAVYPDRVA